MLNPSATPAQDVALFIEPASHHFFQDRLFSTESAKLGGDNLMAPYIHLRDWFQARGVTVHTADYLRAGQHLRAHNVYMSLGILDNYRDAAGRPHVTLSAFFGLECPIVEPTMYEALPEAARHFKRIFSWSDTATLARFTRTPVALQRFWWPQSFDDVHDGPWHRRDRRFAVMINANKLPCVNFQELYTERMRAVEFFGRTGEIDLYGKDWEKPSHRLGKTWVPYTIRRIRTAIRRQLEHVHVNPLLAAARRAWKGRTESKSDTLSQYNFALCFENAILTGWITEKIFDCFFAGTVPVYWGAPDITDYIPADCFIDMRNFSDYTALRAFLHGLGESDIQRYREHARAFIRSERFYRFSKQAFTDIVARIVEEDTGCALGAPVPREHARA